MTAPVPDAVAPAPAVPDPPAEPRAWDWDETPAEAARWDRWWGDRDIDRDEDDA